MLPPTCGLMSTPGARHSGWSEGKGSGSVTSSAALIRPVRQRGDEVVGDHHRPTGSVHQQRARLSSARGTRRRPGHGSRSVSGHSSTTTSASGATSGSSSKPCTSPRAVRATLTTSTSKGTSRRSSASPTLPNPTIRTCLSASASYRPAIHSPAFLRAREVVDAAQRGNDQADDEFSGRLASCTPRALHNVTTARQVLPDVVDTCREGLHDAQVEASGPSPRATTPRPCTAERRTRPARRRRVGRRRRSTPATSATRRCRGACSA